VPTTSSPLVWILTSESSQGSFEITKSLNEVSNFGSVAAFTMAGAAIATTPAAAPDARSPRRVSRAGFGVWVFMGVLSSFIALPPPIGSATRSLVKPCP